MNNKTKVYAIFDTVFWTVFVMLPLLLVLTLSINGGLSTVSDFLDRVTGLFAGVDVYDDINSAIGLNGVYPLLNERTMWFIDYTCFVVYGTVFHLIVDCCKFIPQCAHVLMNKLGGEWFE